jgi:hypothetical protein
LSLPENSPHGVAVFSVVFDTPSGAIVLQYYTSNAPCSWCRRRTPMWTIAILIYSERFVELPCGAFSVLPLCAAQHTYSFRCILDSLPLLGVAYKPHSAHVLTGIVQNASKIFGPSSRQIYSTVPDTPRATFESISQRSPLLRKHTSLSSKPAGHKRGQHRLLRLSLLSPTHLASPSRPLQCERLGAYLDVHYHLFSITKSSSSLLVILCEKKKHGKWPMLSSCE